MGVPKKRTSFSKKRIRKNLWKGKGYWAALKALSLAKSTFNGNSKSFSMKKKHLTRKGFFVFVKEKNLTKNEKGFFIFVRENVREIKK